MLDGMNSSGEGASACSALSAVECIFLRVEQYAPAALKMFLTAEDAEVAEECRAVWYELGGGSACSALSAVECISMGMAPASFASAVLHSGALGFI
jgi:hypothetical protein